MRDGVGDARSKRTRISLFAVRARVAEHHPYRSIALKRLSLPHHLVESTTATMQMIGPVGGGELIRFSVERETPFRDPVSISSDDRAEIRRVAQIGVETVKSKNDVVEPPLAIRCSKRHDRTAIAA